MHASRSAGVGHSEGTGGRTPSARRALSSYKSTLHIESSAAEQEHATDQYFSSPPPCSSAGSDDGALRAGLESNSNLLNKHSAKAKFSERGHVSVPILITPSRPSRGRLGLSLLTRIHRDCCSVRRAGRRRTRMPHLASDTGGDVVTVARTPSWATVTVTVTASTGRRRARGIMRSSSRDIRVSSRFSSSCRRSKGQRLPCQPTGRRGRQTRITLTSSSYAKHECGQGPTCRRRARRRATVLSSVS